MIFGGLELVAGGYLVHRHYRKKNKKEELEQEVQSRRHHTFPGVNNAKPSGWNTQAHHRPQYHQQPPQQPPQQHPIVSQQKFTYHAPDSQPLPSHHQQFQPPQQSRPQPPTHTQSFTIPRRPVPQRNPEIIIQPSLQRNDSFATLSRMPIANGSRPHDLPDEQSPQPPPQRHATGLLPAPQHNVYGNAGFSVSSPALGATPTSPPVTYTMATGSEAWRSVDDNWETYGHGDGRPGHAPTESTQLGERDPPPPYMP